MNAVGIDVSKGKSMVCVMRPFGEVVLEPFEVLHTAQNLRDLAEKLKALDGETRVVLESTGNYHKPVAFVLHDAGLFVSVVNPVLIHDYDNNSLRRVKTDRKDAVKIANYTLDKWTRLRQYLPEDDTRLALKNCYRQYQQAVAIRTMLKNNLISSLDLTFPDANKLFASPPKSNGCEKWVDFIGDFWHSECVSSLSEEVFAKKYLKWCQKHGYIFTRSKSDEIYACALNSASLPKSPTSKLLIQQQVAQLKAVSQSVAAFQQEIAFRHCSSVLELTLNGDVWRWSFSRPQLMARLEMSAVFPPRNLSLLLQELSRCQMTLARLLVMTKESAKLVLPSCAGRFF